jgi:hypothetical protein
MEVTREDGKQTRRGQEGIGNLIERGTRGNGEQKTEREKM